MKKFLKSGIYGSINSAGWFTGEKSTFVATVHQTVHEQ